MGTAFCALVPALTFHTKKFIPSLEQPMRWAPQPHFLKTLVQAAVAAITAHWTLNAVATAGCDPRLCYAPVREALGPREGSWP